MIKFSSGKIDHLDNDHKISYNDAYNLEEAYSRDRGLCGIYKKYLGFEIKQRNFLDWKRWTKNPYVRSIKMVDVIQKTCHRLALLADPKNWLTVYVAGEKNQIKIFE